MEKKDGSGSVDSLLGQAKEHTAAVDRTLQQFEELEREWKRIKDDRARRRKQSDE